MEERRGLLCLVRAHCLLSASFYFKQERGLRRFWKNILLCYYYPTDPTTSIIPGWNAINSSKESLVMSVEFSGIKKSAAAPSWSIVGIRRRRGDRGGGKTSLTWASLSHGHYGGVYEYAHCCPQHTPLSYLAIPKNLQRLMGQAAPNLQCTRTEDCF